MDGASWTPQQGQVEQLVEYLCESLSGRDGNARRQAEIMLKQANASPDFDNYLCYLLTGLPQSQMANYDSTRLHVARSAAGVMLKNDIKANFKTMPASTTAFIKMHIFAGLQDSNVQMRNYAGLVVAELLKQATPAAWPEAIERLLATASNEDGKTPVEAQEGAATALKSVCEDNKKIFSKSSQDDSGPLRFLVQKLIAILQSPSSKVRANAIASLTVFIEDKAPTVMQNLREILERLFGLSQDSSADVRRFLCRAVVQIAQASPSSIVPYLSGLAGFVLEQQQNQEDQDLALEATEFWLLTADQPDTVNHLGPYLPKIVPVLLENMIYPEDDVLRLENDDADDANEDDRQQDIRPQFATSKAARAGTSGVNENNGSQHNASSVDDRDDLSEGEIEEDDPTDDGDDDPEDMWTLRKCSAASLDTLAGVFPQAVFDATLPYLQSNLTHSEWQNREAAVLAIGAIAEGCMEVLEPHLPNLVPFLVDLLNDKQAIVRQITCWSLGRYSAWASHLNADGKAQFFVPMMDGILKRMLDNNKRVQEAAASAFANLEEKANTELADPAYCEVIVKQFAQCFAKYKERNMFILYDCVQTLAEHVALALQSSEIIHHLMPPLITRWKQVKDTDQEMFPLLECLSYVATCLGNTFSPYAEPLFGRCIRITYDSLQQLMESAGDPSAEAPDPDFIITSLDLLSAIIQALGDRSADLVQTSKPNMFELLQFCLENPENDVRQSAYALLGDCAIHVFTNLEPQLTQVMPSLIKQLNSPKENEGDEGGYAVTNNACWSCGEITMRAGSKMEPYAEVLMQRLYAILSDSDLPNSLHDNAALALGRLGNGCADKMSPHLATIGPPFVKQMRTISWEDEKLHAMRGFSLVVLQNPQASEQFLVDFVNEIGSGSVALGASDSRFRGAEGPYEQFQQVLQTYARMGIDFRGVLGQLPSEHAQAIQKLYSV